MQLSHKLTHSLLALFVLALTAMTALAQAAGPGTPLPAESGISDQKAGSVLIYNVYTSKITNPGAENTRINITNTNTLTSAFVHFFFVDSSNCMAADTYVCLTPNQTFAFNMSEIDPDVMGYVVAVATDKDGLPAEFNYLIGDEYVKFASGHAANLGAEAISKLTSTNVVSTDGTLAALFFDGVLLAGSYNTLPRVLAVDQVMSSEDGNNTLLIVNRIGGNLAGGTVSSIGNAFGLLFDSNEKEYSFSFSGSCQIKTSLSNSFPRTAPRFTTVIPKGREGYMKFWATSNAALLGAAINYNPKAGTGTDPNAHTGGHNLHKLTYTNAATFTIPVFGVGGGCTY